ncbi:MAG TPA: hypothetical protein VJN18_22265 [Polyangiaceae bacterium]|nr:hypothetical protein [Polyangiaceae bacterium]
MFLTAQRVVSPATHRQGVNVYHYLHGGYVWNDMPEEFLNGATNGELVAQWLNLKPPGGNRVISFLDIVAPDDVPAIDLQQRLASLKHWLQPRGDPTLARWDGYWVRFSCPERIPWTTELGALAGHILLSITEGRV